MSKKTYYTVRDVARALEVGTSTVHSYIKRGQLQAYQIAGRGPYRIKTEEYQRFLKENNSNEEIDNVG